MVGREHAYTHALLYYMNLELVYTAILANIYECCSAFRSFGRTVPVPNYVVMLIHRTATPSLALNHSAARVFGSGAGHDDSS